MMKDTSILTAIDVGTTKVCTVIGRCSKKNGVEILGYGVVPCSGLSKGNVTDVSATRAAVRASVELAEKASGQRVTEAYVGVTGSHVAFENRRDTLDWVGKMGVITVEDLERVPDKVASASETSGRKVIHALPLKYSLDGGYEVRDPLGMHTDRIQVETHLVTGASYFVSKLVDVVESAGVKVADLVLEPLASSQAVLTDQEKNRGVALVDIGGGTTDIVVFRKGGVIFTDVIPVGGYQFTNDIAMTYNTSYEAAEEIKLKHAHTQPDTVRPDEEVIVPVNGRPLGLKIPRHEICQLTRERAQELVRLISLKLKDAGVNRDSEANVVLTGGASNLQGIQQLMQRYVAGKVRLDAPNGRWNLPEALRHPSYSTAVGILLWSIDNQKNESIQKRSHVPNGTNGHNGAAAHNGVNGHASTGVRVKSDGVMTRFFRSIRSIF